MFSSRRKCFHSDHVFWCKCICRKHFLQWKDKVWKFQTWSSHNKTSSWHCQDTCFLFILRSQCLIKSFYKFTLDIHTVFRPYHINIYWYRVLSCTVARCGWKAALARLFMKSTNYLNQIDCKILPKAFSRSISFSFNASSFESRPVAPDFTSSSIE